MQPNNTLARVLLALICGGMLSISFLENAAFLLVWIAFVPLLYAIHRASYLTTYLLGVLAGFVAFAGATFWVVDFIVLSKGYAFPGSLLLAIFLWLYSAHVIALSLLLFQWLSRRSGWNALLLFPLSLTALIFLFPMIFAMQLGETQVQFLLALQAIEFTGTAGLSSIIALVNVLIFNMVNRVVFNITPSRLINSLALGMVAAWFVYGAIANQRWQQWQQTAPKMIVGLVQPNEIPRLGSSVRHPDYSFAFPPEMELTEALAKQGAELIVWPEAQAKEYLDNPNIAVAYSRNIARASVPLLFQDTESVINPRTGEIAEQYNSAVLIGKNGQQLGRYRKLKLIPFGETIPFVSSDSAFRASLESFLAEFLNEITPGQGYSSLSFAAANIVPLICYETTHPEFVAKAVEAARTQTPNQKPLIIAALSNDGWFDSRHQASQHILASTLRAVENRLPLIHSVNNGPSIVVAPNGAIVRQTPFRQAGGYLAEVPLGEQTSGSFYSRYPQWFKLFVLGLLCLVVVMSVLGSKTPNSKI